MSPDPAQQVACRTCGSLLNRYVDLDTGKMRYTHPASPTLEPADHEPDPVPADQIDAHYVCDFCSDEKIVYTFRVNPVEMVVVAANEQLVQHYGSTWPACIECADLVQARDANGLSARIARAGVPFDRRAMESLRTMQRAVVDSIQPGRALAVIGRWQPTPLPAPILPKIRDRLTCLIRGDDELPYGLDHPNVRGQLAAGLDAAGLYWIDDEFTDLAGHAAGRLPATTVTAADAPAPHGLLAWAQPVGDRADITAATWTSGPDGIRLVCYRSIGAGLPPGPLQRPRTGRLAGPAPDHPHSPRRCHRHDQPSQHRRGHLAAHRAAPRRNHPRRSGQGRPQGVPAHRQTSTRSPPRPHPRHRKHLRHPHRTAARRAAWP
jgi:hypothetical protein